MGEPTGGGFNPLSAVAGLIPMVGNTISSLIQRKWAIKDRDHLEAYYSPVDQVKRLKEAGLSPGMLYGSRAAGQSEQPRSTEFNTGAKEGVQAAVDVHSSTRLNQLQAQLLQQQIRDATYTADVKEKDRNDYLGNPNANKATGLEYDINNKKLTGAGKEIQNSLSSLSLETRKALNGEGLLTERGRQEVYGMIARNQNDFARYGQILASTGKTQQEVVNLITTNQKTQQEISNLVSSNARIQADTKRILTQEKYVQQLIQVANLEEDQKESALMKMYYELDQLGMLKNSRDVLFNKPLSSYDNPIDYMKALSSAAMFYGLEKVSTFVGTTIK